MKNIFKPIVPNKVKLYLQSYLSPYKKYNEDLCCIFIHIPKTAGTSIAVSLFGQEVGHYSILRYMQYKKQNINKFFKFAFVRNPWDRFLSAFLFLKGGGVTVEDKLWSKRYLSNFKDFESFVCTLKDERYRKKILEWKHFMPQWQFVCDSNSENRMDFIGQFENLGSDFEYVKKRLNVDEKISLKNLNASYKKNYRDHYSFFLQNLIYEIYKEDVKLFNYTF